MGAYPGIDAEERGQAEAIAYNLREMSRLGVPVIAIVIGEGGSGGALGLGVGNRIYMLENAYYSVISPESCAAIIYRDSGRAAEAAQALADDGAGSANAGPDRRHRAGAGRRRAHRLRTRPLKLSRKRCRKALAELAPLSPQALIDERYR